ncbi:MAG: tRNA (adenine-N1)-methyltransferase [Thermoplasmatota archaeon]
MEYRFSENEQVLIIGSKGSQLLKLKGPMVTLGPGKGAISTSRLTGMESGSRISVGSREFILLRPDIRDISEHIERGAQIVVPKDSSFITYGLGLSDGMRVIEGGAGSGALTIALLNAVAPKGAVVTYDIREDHLENARRNISSTPFLGNWEGRIGDICNSGSGEEFDAAVIDIPNPEDAVPAIRDSLCPGSRFCAYVPTVNQMERATLELERSGFMSIEPLEIIHRPYSVKKDATRPVHEILAHTGYVVFARWPGSP